MSLRHREARPQGRFQRVLYVSRSIRLTNNLGRLLVFTQALKCCVTQEAVLCPLSKRHLSDELRLEPAKLLHLIRGDPFAEMAFATTRQIIKRTLIQLLVDSSLREVDADPRD